MVDGNGSSQPTPDIQAFVVHTRKPHLIVGNYQKYFDQAVYERYKHQQYVRLWLPLFPFPPSLLPRLQSDPLNEFQQFLAWGEPELVDEAVCVTADWTNELSGGPPVPLTYGTLEVGFLRQESDELSLAPLELDVATMCAAQAYCLSAELYKSTLPGTIDAIGRAMAAVVWPGQTKLRVPMPSWRTPEVWTYPEASQWQVGIPVRGESPDGAPELTALVDFGNSSVVAVSTNLSDPLKKSVEEAVRLALRLDDQTADLYTLIETAEEQRYVGTQYPDPRLAEILQEICRESGARKSLHFLFECSDSVQDGRQWTQVGRPVGWPSSEMPADPDNAGMSLVDDALKNEHAEYNQGHGFVALPLSLDDRKSAVILLAYSAEIEFSDSRRMELEGRVGRWGYRLSLRHLLLQERFARLASQLREEIRQVRSAVNESADNRHIDQFSQVLLSKAVERLGLVGTMLTIFSAPETGPPSVERYWCRGLGDKASHKVMNDRFVGEAPAGPCKQAVTQGKMLVYEPGDSSRSTDLADVIQDFRSREQQLEEDSDGDRLAQMHHLVGLVESNVLQTVLVIPLLCREPSTYQFQAVLTVFLPGEHHFTSTHRQLIQELGSMIGEALADAVTLDIQTYEKAGSDRLEILRKELDQSKNSDDIVGLLLRALSSPPPHKSTPLGTTMRERWSLSNDIVFWELASDRKEMVARSWRGEVISVLEELTIIDSREHPFFARASKVGDLAPEQVSPLTNFRPWTLELSRQSDSPLLRAYAGLASYKWLLTFPLARADQKVFGVVDCLRCDPLVPHEESALQVLLRRLSLQVYAALDRSFYESAFATARYLTEKTEPSFQMMRAQEAYQFLVQSVKEQVGFEHCDLFLERNGTMLLHASSRLKGAVPDAKRADYLCRADASGDVLGRALSSRRHQVSHAGGRPKTHDDLSLQLRKHLEDDYEFERLAIPLSGSQQDRVTGLLYVRGPLSEVLHKTPGHSSPTVKKTGLIAQEHIRRVKDLAIVMHRIARMAALIEQQGWLIDELQHSLGQRLQLVRSWADDCLRTLNQSRFPAKKVADLRWNLRRGFDQVREAMANLEIYARMATHFETSGFQRVDLAVLINACRHLMDPQAVSKNCNIVRSIRKIEPVYAHETLLRTAVWNLLDNAIKYSWDGRDIEVKLTESKGSIRLIIENYGVGIPRPDLKRIFQPYVRSAVPDAKGARRGSGIGLAVVRHIIETVHRGHIDARSDPTAGVAPGESPEQTANHPYITTLIVRLSRTELESLGS